MVGKIATVVLVILLALYTKPGNCDEVLSSLAEVTVLCVTRDTDNKLSSSFTEDSGSFCW